MKRNVAILGFAVVVIAFLLVVGSKFTQRRQQAAAFHGQQTGEFAGKPAPDFELETLDGQRLTLASLRGKAVVVNFWATWCEPCKLEIPWLVDFQNRYGSQGLQVVGIAEDDSGKEKIAAFAKEIGMNYPVLLGDEKVSAQYGDVEALPTTFYISRDGRIVERTAGLAGKAEIDESIQKALSAPVTLSKQ